MHTNMVSHIKTRLISIESQPKKSGFVVVFVMKVVVVCIIVFLVVVNIDIIGLVVLVVLFLYIVVLGTKSGQL